MKEPERSPPPLPALRIDARESPLVLSRAKDTAMAVCLLCMLAGIVAKWRHAFPLALIVLVSGMVFPQLWKRPARLWFGLSKVLGKVTSPVVLAAIFFLVVTPVGFIRRLAGADPLRKREWKQGRGSVFRDGQGPCRPEDLFHPF